MEGNLREGRQEKREERKEEKEMRDGDERWRERSALNPDYREKPKQSKLPPPLQLIVFIPLKIDNLSIISHVY